MELTDNIYKSYFFTVVSHRYFSVFSWNVELKKNLSKLIDFMSNNSCSRQILTGAQFLRDPTGFRRKYVKRAALFVATAFSWKHISFRTYDTIR